MTEQQVTRGHPLYAGITNLLRLTPDPRLPNRPLIERVPMDGAWITDAGGAVEVELFAVDDSGNWKIHDDGIAVEPDRYRVPLPDTGL